MNKNNIYVDTNIIIGAVVGKSADKQCLQYLYSLTGKRLYLSCLSIAQFVSTLQKNTNNEFIRKQVKFLLLKFNIISFTKEDVEISLTFTNTDIEDNIQYAIGCKTKCYYYITNNKKDYKFINIMALKPDEVRLIKR